MTRNSGTKSNVVVSQLVPALIAASTERGTELKSDSPIHTIDAKKLFIDSVQEATAKTFTSNVIAPNGPGKRMFRLKATENHSNYVDPILIIGTDGIGSKIEIGKQIRKLDTIGIDLVAMCVNDILCNGAEPLTFLDYYACNRIDPGLSNDIVSGVVEGVTLSECSLIGGHTIEVPDLYEKSEFDMAGFALGIVDNAAILPKTSELGVGDVIIGLPSDGVHSNGFSLVHKVMQVAGHKFEEPADFSACGKTYGRKQSELKGLGI